MYIGLVDSWKTFEVAGQNRFASAANAEADASNRLEKMVAQGAAFWKNFLREKRLFLHVSPLMFWFMFNLFPYVTWTRMCSSNLQVHAQHTLAFLPWP